MATLRFPIGPALRVAQHALKAPEQRPIAYTNNPVTQPAVILVHDNGVYLMSNGLPNDEIGTPTGKGNEGVKCFCAYADGCDPTTQEFDDWWETSRALVGGDDFAETLEGWAEAITTLAAGGAVAIKVKITSKTIGISGEYQKAKGQTA